MQVSLTPVGALERRAVDQQLVAEAELFAAVTAGRLFGFHLAEF